MARSQCFHWAFTPLNAFVMQFARQSTCIKIIFGCSECLHERFVPSIKAEIYELGIVCVCVSVCVCVCVSVEVSDLGIVCVSVCVCGGLCSWHSVWVSAWGGLISAQ